MNDVPTLLKVAQVVLKRTYFSWNFPLKRGTVLRLIDLEFYLKQNFRYIHLVEIDPVALKMWKLYWWSDRQTDATKQLTKGDQKSSLG